MRRLQTFELLHQAIKLSIRNFRIVEDVIPMFVPSDGFSQPLEFCFRIHRQFKPLTKSKSGLAPKGVELIAIDQIDYISKWHIAHVPHAFGSEMKKAALIYNPAAGRKRRSRTEDVEKAGQVLRAAGVQVITVPTRTAGSAGAQAEEAIANGYDTIIACGGDGTVHEVLQGVVRHGTMVALGCLPLGTGNVLANDLGLPRNPVAAARKLLSFVPRTIAAGKVEFQRMDSSLNDSRYFAVMAGAGVDAQLPYSLTQPFKDRYGMAGYVAQGLRIYLAHDFPLFEVEFVDSVARRPRKESVSLAFAIRVKNFGGFMRRFVPESGLERDDVQILLYKPRNGHRLLLYMILAFLGRRWNVPGIELVHAKELQCRPLPRLDGPRSTDSRTRPRPIYSQADGELLGLLPVRISVTPNAFSLLMPKPAAVKKMP